MVYLVTSQTGFILLAIAAPLLIAIALRLPPRFRVLRVCMMTLLPVLSASLALALFNRASVWLAGRADADFWHLLFAGLAVAMIAIPLFLRRAPVVLTCLPFAGMIVVLLGWSAYLFPATVRENIKGIALNSPYCISQRTRGENIYGSGHYPLMRPVSSFDQFNYLTFAQGESALVIERPHKALGERLDSPVSVHDWRPDDGGFDRDVTGYVSAFGGMTGCIPWAQIQDAKGERPDRELVMFEPVWQNNDVVRLDRVDLRIPSDLHPAIGDYSGSGLVIATTLPDFTAPDAETLHDRKRWGSVALYFGRNGMPQDMAAMRVAEYGAIYITSPENGTAMDTRPVDGNGLHNYEDNASSSTYYAQYRDTVEWITSIRCYFDRCEHFFLPEHPIPGFYGPIVFDHPPEMLPQWRDMETVLEARFRSFVVTD